MCAHWLGGFQDENNDITGWPGNVTCNPVPCPDSYMPSDFDTSFDKTLEYPTPWGTGNIKQCGVHKGQCWDDSLHFSHDQVGEIAKCVMDKFDNH